MEKSNTAVAALAFLMGCAVLSAIVLYPMMTGKIDDATLNNMSLTALGMLGTSVVSAGGSWFMRGRTERAGTGSGDGTTTTVTTDAPAAVSVETPIALTATSGTDKPKTSALDD